MTRITGRGIRLILSGVILLFFGYMLGDYLLIGASVVLAGFLVLQYLELSRASEEMGGFTVTPSVLALTVVAGEEVTEVVQTSSSSRLDWSIDLGLDYLHAEPGVVGFGEGVTELVYSPVLGGVKQVEQITLMATDRYRFFKAKSTVDVAFTFTSYPRVFPVAARALTYLSEMGVGRQGEQATDLRGGGLEYAESRPYHPGDPLNRFDWKAYAKTTKPMVKEYLVEGGGGTSILYDNVTDNPVSMDELNHAFLSLVLTLTQQDEPTQINLLEQRESYELDRHNTLLVAVQIALEGQTREFIQYYGLIEPRRSRVNLFQRLLDQKHRSTRATAYSTNIIVTALTGNPRWIYETIENITSQEISLLIPTKPWLWQTSLVKTNKVYNACLKNLERLQQQGVYIHQSLDNLLYKIETKNVSSVT